ncbi:hypothetical protein GCM10008908_32450 [Clostridium subterminale]|uniref:Ornithine cyclodeaminase n=1 Tax=Clostridium subterminale TaxID=1550 RepID=A0ABP3W827_CLOSU
MLGRKQVRDSDTEVTIFDATGMGIQDNTLADLIYNKALSMGIGSKIKLL